MLPRTATVRQYIAGLYRRARLGIIDLPDAGSDGEVQQAGLRVQSAAGRPGDRPPNGPRTTRSRPRSATPSPIKHCIYVIKENRTYDQVFGDMKEGNGDPNLCIFPEKVTPNHHNWPGNSCCWTTSTVDGEVSADGHEWSMGAYCTDFVEKVWPLSYRGSPTKKLNIYPSEGNFDEIARPAGGYIWDRCAEAEGQLSQLRRMDRQRQDARRIPARPASRPWKAISIRCSAASIWTTPTRSGPTASSRNCKRFEKEGDMPQLHRRCVCPTTTPPAPRSASRRRPPWWPRTTWPWAVFVEAISKSKFWKETAIFVIEDDAQNGPDHVDAHRTVALVISPYTQARQGRFDDVFHEQHAADDGADPGPETDEPVRRRGPADVQRVPDQARTSALQARRAGESI